MKTIQRIPWTGTKTYQYFLYISLNFSQFVMGFSGFLLSEGISLIVEVDVDSVASTDVLDAVEPSLELAKNSWLVEKGFLQQMLIEDGKEDCDDQQRWKLDDEVLRILRTSNETGWNKIYE